MGVHCLPQSRRMEWGVAVLVDLQKACPAGKRAHVLSVQAVRARGTQHAPSRTLGRPWRLLLTVLQICFMLFPYF